MSKPNIVVLGSGMAGFGAAHRLHQEGIEPVMYDKNSYYGGHTMSFRYESGFLFDVGPIYLLPKMLAFRSSLPRASVDNTKPFLSR